MNWTGPPLAERIKIETSDDVCGIWRDFVATRESFDPSKESLILIALNIRRDFMGWHLVSVGNATGAMAEPRDIFRAALRLDAVEFVIVHNHPSGCVLPSGTDERLTKLIGEVSRLVGVGFVDHVVVNSPGTESYSIRGGRPDFFCEPGRASKTRPLSSPESGAMAAHAAKMNPPARDAEAASNIGKRAKAKPSKKPSGSEPTTTDKAAETTQSPMWTDVEIQTPTDYWRKFDHIGIEVWISESIKGVKREKWLQRWQDPNDMKNILRPIERLTKSRSSQKFRVRSADLDEVNSAAAEAGESPGRLLFAILLEAAAEITALNEQAADRCAKSQGMAPPKIVTFRR
jgi:hypothetical protein